MLTPAARRRGITSGTLLIVLLAGCITDSSTPTLSDSSTNAAVKPTMKVLPNAAARVFDFSDCSQLNVMDAYPAAGPGSMEDLPHGLKVRTMDPAGTTFEVTYASLGCKDLSADGHSLGASAMAFTLIPVHPLDPGMQGVDEYYWLAFFVSKVESLNAVVASYGTMFDAASVEVTFADLAGREKARGQAKIGAPLDATAETVMVGQLTARSAKTIGFYTGEDQDPLRFHYLSATAYKGYDHGTAVIDSIPLPVADIVTPARATHDFGHNVRFDLRDTPIEKQ